MPIVLNTIKLEIAVIHLVGMLTAVISTKQLKMVIPLKLGNFLESLGVGRCSSNNNSFNIDIELLNKHFSSSDALDSVKKEELINALSSLPTHEFPPFCFSPFTERDVKMNILSISWNAVGTDCISRKMIMPILDIVIPILTHILNFSISVGKFPETKRI